MSDEQEYCEKCNHIGWLFDSEGAVYRCECVTKVNAKQRFANLGISRIMQDKKFSSYIVSHPWQQSAKETAYGYAVDFPKIKDTPHNSIMFMGQSGSGKTHLTMAITNKIINEHNTAVTYMQYREAIMTLKQVMTDKDNYQKEKDKYFQASVLLIDDLFKGKLTDTDASIMFEIINYRYNNNKPIIPLLANSSVNEQ